MFASRLLTGALAISAAFLLAGSGLAAEPQLFRITTVQAGEKSAARQLGTVVEDYGNFVIVSASGARAEALQRDGAASGLAIEALDVSIGLRDFKFDPRSANPARARGLQGAAREAASAEGDYYLVQFHAPIREAWLKELRALGAETVQYVPNQAYLIYAKPAALEAIARHEKVRWTGAFEPIYRVATELTWIFQPAGQRTEKVSEDGTYLVAVFKRAEARPVEDALVRQGKLLKADRLPDGAVFNLYRLSLTPEALSRVAAMRDVYAIEPYVKKSLEDERGAQVLAGNYSGTAIANLNAPPYDPVGTFGTDGTNVSVAVVDSGIQIPGPSGFYITADRAVSAPLRGASGSSYLSGHGHLCSTIIGGAPPFSVLDGLGYNYGRGVAPGVNLVSVPQITSTYTGSDTDAVNDTVSTLPPNGIRATISNNSWGNGSGVNYTALEAMFDGFVRDASSAASVDSLLLVFSSGNAGPGAQTMTRPKSAKNVLTVGSSVGLRPELPSFQGVPNSNLDFMSNYSSRGPTQDGRTKPDVSAPGQQITGPRTSSNSDGFSAVSGDTVHIYGSGTSFAAPHASGGAAIFTGWWKATRALQPSPALVKAALINGAVDMNAEFAGVAGSSTTAVVPNSTEGWGRINLRNSVNSPIPTHYIDESVVFTQLTDSYTYAGSITSSASPLRITLVWTDVPGAAGANPAGVNDLDLIVTVGANTYRGNVFAGGVSTTGGTADRRNNVERVVIPNLAPGTNFSVQVVPAALNGNGVLGTPGNNQHFALVVQNTNASGCPAIDITPNAIPSSIARGSTYPTQTFASTGGAAPVVLSLVGSVPPGMTYSNGTLSGTPNTAGTYNFSISALDANGCLGARAYSIQVTAPDLQRGAVSITTGNARLEPSECNSLNVTLNNPGTGAATAVSATLTSSTPGVTIASGPIGYGTIAAGGNATNPAPFVVGTDGTVPCYTNVNFTLTVTYAEGNPAVFQFALPVGLQGTAYSFASVAATTLPTDGTLLPGSQDDDAAVALTMPFSCTIYGVTIDAGSTILAGTNGTLQFDSVGTTAYSNVALPVSTSTGAVGVFPATRPTLFPFWDDLNLTGSTSSFGIYTKVAGSAPNRTLTVEWRGVRYNTTVAVNFAVLLREGSSTFDFIYNNSTGTGANGTSATIGVQAASSGTVFTQFALNTAGTYTGGATLRATLPPGDCTPGTGPCSSAPVITSAAPTAPVIVGTPFSHSFTASGSPAPEFALTAGTLPPGLSLSRSGVLNGTATSGGSGSWPGITVTASNGNAPAATQTFSLTTVTRSANYFAAYGLSGGNAAPGFDFDLDGLSNLLEYAFALDPSVVSATPVDTQVRNYGGTNYLSVRFPRSTLATDLTYIVEVAADLGVDPIVWTELARSTAGGATTGAGFVSETGSAPQMTVEVRDTVPVPTVGQPRRFLRVRVQ
ncbi:MAG: S8 family serine peptidase [Verrucomicrobia bacterium]|nr:S8 family serine peptidase [Verrucomicrobiota bacterium]